MKTEKELLEHDSHRDIGSELLQSVKEMKAGRVGHKHAFHTHVSDEGFLVKCFHKSKRLFFSWEFWIGVTFSFPLEHFLWEKIWPFYVVTKWLGL